MPSDDPNDHYEQFIPKPLPPPHGRLWVQLLLLVLTFITTTLAGSLHYLSFTQDLASADLPPLAEPPLTAILTDPAFYIHGLWYSLTILAILGCHEMGHYVMCLRYDVIATRPFFLPVPPVPFMTGTLGAFIRIKSRIPTKIALFDIGIAGPIAGFVVAVPMLFAGLAMSRVDRLPQDASHLIELGEPLMFKFAAFLVWGHVGGGSSINMHPMAFAAWFGLLATALNLFPISQLDGGHIAYAVFGRRSTIVSLVMISIAVGLTTFVSLSWIVWTVLTIVMLFVVGPHHPPTLDDETPLDGKRLVLAAIALGMLIVCFTPAPIGPFIGAQ